MLLVYLTSGVCVEVPDAVSAEQRDERLVCLDAEGNVVSSYQAQYVSASSDPVMVEAIEDEVCEDLVVVPPGADHQGGARRR